jgi:uncharacterized protein YutE (UPF0331/DUF86 family)
MRRFSVAITPPYPGPEAAILDEERVRDQLSAAEELVYSGHREPALVAAGVAVEGAIRLAGGPMAGHRASPAALLEALVAYQALDDREQEQLTAALAARDRLVQGYAPPDPALADPRRVTAVLELAIRLLEPTAATRFRQSEN